MKSNWITFIISGFIIANVCSFAYARIHLRKLSASDVYKALQEAGRLDAIPEGRVVTQGIAAATGFIAGITKGIGIPLLLGLAMPRPSSSNGNGEQVTTQEICFSSRSVDERDDESEKNKAHDGVNEKEGDKPEGRQTTTSTPETPTTTNTATPTTTTTGTSPTTGTQTTPTTTSGGTPTTTTGTNGGTGGETTTNTGDGTGTNTESTTQTGTGGAVNCIIIQKPVNG